MHTDFASIFAKFRRFAELFSKYGYLNELLESEKFLSPSPSGAPEHGVRNSPAEEMGTINTLSTVTPVI